MGDWCFVKHLSFLSSINCQVTFTHMLNLPWVDDMTSWNIEETCHHPSGQCMYNVQLTSIVNSHFRWKSPSHWLRLCFYLYECSQPSLLNASVFTSLIFNFMALKFSYKCHTHVIFTLACVSFNFYNFFKCHFSIISKYDYCSWVLCIPLFCINDIHVCDPCFSCDHMSFSLLLYWSHT